jgi:hypothetical protein
MRTPGRVLPIRITAWTHNQGVGDLTESFKLRRAGEIPLLGINGLHLGTETALEQASCLKQSLEISNGT